MSYSKDDYYKDVLSKSFDENGITATSEQIDDVVTDIVVSVGIQWMLVYEQPEQIAAPELIEALINFRSAFVLAVGDQSPYAKCALAEVDTAIAKSTQ